MFCLVLGFLDNYAVLGQLCCFCQLSDRLWPHYNTHRIFVDFNKKRKYLLPDIVLSNQG